MTKDKIEFTEFLHDQETHLNLLKRNLEPLREALLDSDEWSKRNTHEIFINLKECVERIVNCNRDLLLVIAERKNYMDIDIEKNNPILDYNDTIMNYCISTKQLNPALIYDKTKVLERAVRTFKYEPIPNEKYKNIVKQINILKQMLSCFFLVQACEILDGLQEKISHFHKTHQNEDKLDVIIEDELLPFNVIEVIDNVLSRLKIKSDRKRIEYRKNYNTNELYVVATKPRITRAFENLFDNAIKYTRPLRDGNAWISIWVESVNNSIVIKIENWGIGIQEDDINSGKIFQYGGRGYLPETLNIEGSGQGLTYAKEAIEKSKGSITIFSKLAHTGYKIHDINAAYLTTVTVMLPKHEPR